jgi:hypothetical protein
MQITPQAAEHAPRQSFALPEKHTPSLSGTDSARWSTRANGPPYYAGDVTHQPMSRSVPPISSTHVSTEPLQTRHRQTHRTRRSRRARRRRCTRRRSPPWPARSRRRRSRHPCRRRRTRRTSPPPQCRRTHRRSPPPGRRSSCHHCMTRALSIGRMPFRGHHAPASVQAPAATHAALVALCTQARQQRSSHTRTNKTHTELAAAGAGAVGGLV